MCQLGLYGRTIPPVESIGLNVSKVNVLLCPLQCRSDRPGARIKVRRRPALNRANPVKTSATKLGKVDDSSPIGLPWLMVPKGLINSGGRAPIRHERFRKNEATAG